MTESVWKDSKATGKMEGNKLVVDTTMPTGMKWHDEWTLAEDGKTYAALRQMVSAGNGGRKPSPELSSSQDYRGSGGLTTRGLRRAGLTDNGPMPMKRTFAALALTVAAFGQTPLVPPANVPYGISISPDNAKKVAAAAIAEARKNNWAMAVAVVDTGGYLVYFERMQDTQLGSVEVAIEKAKSAALFRRPTKAFQDTLAAGGEGLRILRLTGATPVEGGIPIIVDGKLIGAVGASGGSSDQDGRTAQAGAVATK